MLLGIVVLAFLIILAIKGFIEWNRPINSHKSETISIYKEDSKAFMEIVTYVQNTKEDIVIEKENNINYKSKKYDEVRGYDIEIDNDDINSDIKTKR